MQTHTFTVTVDKKRYPLIKELFSSLKGVKAKEISADIEEEYRPETKQEILDGFRQSLEELKLIKAGKLKAIPARDLLNEL